MFFQHQHMYLYDLNQVWKSLQVKRDRIVDISVKSY